MKTRQVLQTLNAIALGVIASSSLVAAPMDSAFTYQGRLSFGAAPALDGLYDFTFTLHDASTGGAPIGGAVALNNVPVSNGVFTAQLSFGSAPFTSGEARWLELSVNTNGAFPQVTLFPRQRLSPTPQAIFAGTAATANGVAAGAVTSAGLSSSSVNSGAIVDGTIAAGDLSSGLLNNTFWKLGGNALLPPGLNFLGTLGFTPLELRANNQPVLRLQPNATSPNMLGGHPANGIAGISSGAFIGGGGATDRSNTVSGEFATIVGGHSQRAMADGTFVGGGAGHTNSGLFATVGGGAGHRVSAAYAGVAAGASNQNHAAYGFIGGGGGNFLTLNSDVATIGGGEGNSIVQSPVAVIGGGHDNLIQDAGDGAVISGGYLNSIRLGGLSGAIGGGTFNLVDGSYANIGGGLRNAARNQGATIAGGAYNTNTGVYSAVGGGRSNLASGSLSVIAGGAMNSVSGDHSAVGSGLGNRIESDQSVISGGLNNVILDGSHISTIAGGANNLIWTNSSGASIGGGMNNILWRFSPNATIAGGSNGYIGSFSSNATISGGLDNFISDRSAGSTVSGGVSNAVNATTLGTSFYSRVGGGLLNIVSTSQSASIDGGQGNYVGDSDYATVGGGLEHHVSSSQGGTISGGTSNFLTADLGTIGGGQFNSVSGVGATVPGGQRNSALGANSFAAGYRARALQNGSFAWADSTDADFSTTAANQFAVRANNGVMIQSTNTAMDLRGGGALRVAGAGIGASTPVFIHRATAANINANVTTIDHPHCNGNPNAILIVTQNFNPGGVGGTYNNSAIGVFYNPFTNRWTIFNQDTGAFIPVNAAFNVLVFKP